MPAPRTLIAAAVTAVAALAASGTASATPTLSVSNATVSEAAGTASFTVDVHSANGDPAVSWSLSLSDGSATSGADYGSPSVTSGSAINCIATNGCTAPVTVTVPIVNDTLSEANETFHANATAANATSGSGTVTINDDDPLPFVEVDGDKLTEGNAGLTDAKVEFQLSTPSGQDVNVHWKTADRTAFAPFDYEADSGTVTFHPGQTERSVHIPVVGDTEVEPDEQFEVRVTSIQHALLGDDTANVTIVNDDVPPPPPPPVPPADQGSAGQAGTPASIIVTVPSTQQHQPAQPLSQALAPQAPLDRTGPLMSVAWRGLNDERTVAIKVGCPAGETACRGTLVLRAGGRELGRRSFALAGGESKTLRVHLSRRALRRVLHNGALVARVTAGDAAGNRSLRTRTFVL
jgi:hypothetical protein